MSDKRQKNQLVLAFMEESRSEAPRASVEGTESLAAKRQSESPAIGEQVMEEVCGRENCKQALARVKANKGSAGVDGMTVQQLPEHLKQHWPAIREQLLSGTYEPRPVRRVEIPKPDGGVRKLGITPQSRTSQEARVSAQMPLSVSGTVTTAPGSTAPVWLVTVRAASPAAYPVFRASLPLPSPRPCGPSARRWPPTSIT